MEKAKLLLIFAEVAKQGNMSRAAVPLGMTASAVSQHIRHLERLYGVKLLNRSTRRLELTEAGQVLLHHAEHLVQTMRQADDDMAALEHRPSGQVRISLPTGFINAPETRRLLGTVRERYPDIRIILMAQDEAVDLQHNDADIAIRAGEIAASPDNVARRLASCLMHICAAPDYLAAHPVKQVEDLLAAHWLCHSEAILRAALAELGLSGRWPDSLTECPSSAASAYYLAAEGLGLTLALSLEIAPLLDSGRLKIVLPQHRIAEKNIYAVVAHAKQSAKNTAVLEALKEVFGGKKAT